MYGGVLVSTFNCQVYLSITAEWRHTLKLNLIADNRSELALAA